MSVAVFTVLVALLYLAGKYLFGTKGDMAAGNNGKILLCAILVVIAGDFVRAQFGKCVPGSSFERSRYKTEVYVNLFPEGSESKNYRVPALIEADYSDDRRIYRLWHVTFPNGGRVSFDDSDAMLELGEQIGARSNDGRWWRIEMTRVRPSAEN